MYFHEFQNIKMSALAAALPDNHERLICYAGQFPKGEIERFCSSTGILERYCSIGLGTTSADLCVAAAEQIFRCMDIDRDSIDALIFLTESPDYLAPSTSCIIQYRLKLNNCGIAYDSNIGCTGFPYGIQMACANLMAGCKRVLLLVGDVSFEYPYLQKEDLLFGDCGIAAILERTDEELPPIKIGIRTIGKGYKSLFSPYGISRHPINSFCKDRGIEDTLAYINRSIMQGADVFTFSIKDAPNAAKEFFTNLSCAIEDYDLISIHQANKMIVDNVAKRIKAPAEKVLWTLDRYGNTRGSSTALNICDYVQRENVHSGVKRILNMAFGIGLNIVLADIELDMSRVLPIIRTAEVFDDGIDNFTYFTESV